MMAFVVRGSSRGELRVRHSFALDSEIGGQIVQAELVAENQRHSLSVCSVIRGALRGDGNEDKGLESTGGCGLETGGPVVRG